MTPPQCVLDVLDKPGRYKFLQGDEWYWFFEVDATGRIFQLNPHNMKRDGILSKNGWNECAASGRVEPA